MQAEVRDFLARSFAPRLSLPFDDDLRETALAMTRVEDFLTLTLATLESDDLRREAPQRTAGSRPRG